MKIGTSKVDGEDTRSSVQSGLVGFVPGGGRGEGDSGVKTKEIAL